MTETRTSTHSGFVALLGRPNVGKSTLMNALVGEKLSIVSAKPHTTRHRVLGVLNQGGSQAVFIDTPGHRRRSQKALHRLMARSFEQALQACDLAVLIVDAKHLTKEDEQLIELLERRRRPAILVLNKIDSLRSREELLPRLQELSDLPFLAFVPISAKKKQNLDALVETIMRNLPEGPAIYPPDFKTDRGIEFRAAEIVREKLFEKLHEEVPYGLTVEIETIELTEPGRWLVHALIWIEREGHKPIVIGKSGRVLKSVGHDARIELATLLEGRVHLELWVKVREHWSDNERELNRLGFDSQ